MANKTFVQNSTLTIADNNAEAFGSSVAGTEIIKIRAAVTGVKLDANFERIDLSGTLASYKFVVVSGTGLQIQNVSDSAVVATIPNINQNVKIAFTDGSATLAQTGATVFTLNSAALVVGATGAAATVSLGANVLSTAAADISTAPDASTIFVLTSNIAYEGTAAADTLDLRTTTSPTQTLSGGAAGAGAPNTILVKDGVNISGANVLYFTNLSFDATSLNGTNDLTMTAAQHAAFTGTILASGTGSSGENIILTTIATGLSLFPAVENYTLGNFTNSVTQTAVGQAITGAAGADTVTAITGVTSTSDLLAGANVVIVPNGANISAGTFSFTSGGSNSIAFNLDNAATATLNATQAAVTLSGTGTQSVTLSNAASSLALNAAVETFTLANATNSVTLGAAAQTVVAGTGADTITVAALPNVNTVIAGLAPADAITAATGANIAVAKFGSTVAGATAGAATGAGLLTFVGTTTLTAAQIDGFTTLTGTSTPLLTLTTALTATMLDDAVVTNTLTTIKLADVANNAITAKNTSLASGIVLNIDGTALTGTNQFTFSRGDEVDGKFNIAGGAGADVINYSTTGQLIGSAVVIDTINGGAGTSDELKLTAATGTTLTIATGDSLANITNVEKITAGSSAGVISITRPATTNTNFTTIDLSGDTDATGTNVITSTGANAITTIIGSAGIDTITLGAAAPSTTVTGGTGADTLSIATTNPVTIYDVDGTIAVTGTASAVETMIFATAVTAATTVTGDTGTDVITLGNFANTINVNDAAVSISGGTDVDAITFINTALATVTVIGGTGADTLALPNLANTLSINDASIAVTGGTDVDAITFITTALATVTVIGGTGADTLVLPDVANTLSINDASIAVTGGTNVDAITFITTALATVTVIGGTGADTIALPNVNNVLSINDATVSVTGGTGTDAITFITTALSGVTVDGGVAIGDSIAAVPAAANVATFKDMDSLTLTAGTSTGTYTISGTTATTVAGAVETPTYTITSSALTTITDSATSTAMTIGSTSTGNVAITSGVADATITATSSTGTLNITSANLTNNALAVLTGTGNVTVSGGHSGDTVTVTGLATIGQTFTGSAASIFNVTAGAGAQTITTGAAADIITGGADSGAIDVMTGGLGADTYKFESSTVSGTPALASADRVIGWVDGTDFIAISAGNTFGSGGSVGLAAGAGAIASSAAIAAASTVVQTLAQSVAAASVTSAADLIKLTTAVATGASDQVTFNTAIGTSTVTGLVAGGSTHLVSLYDSTLAQAVFMEVVSNSGTDTVLETGDVVRVIGRVDMSSTDYTNFTTADILFF